MSRFPDSLVYFDTGLAIFEKLKKPGFWEKLGFCSTTQD